MTRLRWVAVGGLVVLLVVVLAADLVLTRMVNRDPLRSRLDALVDEAVGRDCSWESIGVRLLPPRLVIEAVKVAGVDEGSDFVRAESVSLRLALAPLVAGVLVVDSLVVQEASVLLVLTSEGIQLPDFGEGETGPETPGEGGADDAAIAIGIRTVDLEDARLVFEDRTIQPPSRLELVDIDAELEGDLLEGVFDLTLEIEDDQGGRMTAQGAVDLDGDVELDAKLVEFELLPFSPYLAAADELDGRVDGTVTVRGPALRPDAVDGDLRISDAKLVFGDVTVAGPLKLEFHHSGPWTSPRGSFRIDATEARANLAGVYEKAPGRPATITGKLRSKDGKLGFDDVELKIENVKATGSVDLGDRVRAKIVVAPIDMAHWQPLLTPLSDYELSGKLLSEGWEIRSDPFEVEGRVDVRGVRLQGPAGRAIAVDGSLVASGDVVRTVDVVLGVAGQRVPVEAEVTDLGGDWRYRVRLQTKQADSNRLMSDFVGHPDTLFGPLDLNGDLTGSLIGDRSFLRSLGGRTGFHVSPGKLKGVSILEATLEQFDQMGRPLGKLLAPRGGLAPRMKEFYKDDFLVLSANLVLDGGVATTQDLRLLTDAYEFKMQGKIDLEDLGLDARGEILFGEELSRAVAARFGLKEIPLVQPFVIPIPRLRGTLTDPKPEPDFTFLIKALTGNLPGVRGMQELLKGVDGLMKQP